MYLKIISAAILLFFTSSCQSRSDITIITKSLDNSTGKVIDDHYYDSNGWFSVALPQNCSVKISAQHTPNTSLVSFMDEEGNLMRFEIYQSEALGLLTTNDIEIVLRGVLEEVFIGNIATQFPGTNLTHVEFMENEQQLFGIVEIPKGNTCVLAENYERLDATRGYLLFFAEDKLVVISNQFSIADTEINKSIYGKNFSNETFLKEVLVFKKALKLTKAN